MGKISLTARTTSRTTSGPMTMTVADVEARIKEIETYDDEVAHSSEDALHHDVLRAIASGECDADVARDLASAALKSLDLDHARWYA